MTRPVEVSLYIFLGTVSLTWLMFVAETVMRNTMAGFCGMVTVCVQKYFHERKSFIEWCGNSNRPDLVNSSKFHN